MKKHWIVTSKNYATSYETVDAAIVKAKIKSIKEQCEYVVYEAIQTTVIPVPAVEMSIL